MVLKYSKGGSLGKWYYSLVQVVPVVVKLRYSTAGTWCRDTTLQYRWYLEKWYYTTVQVVLDVVILHYSTGGT